MSRFPLTKGILLFHIELIKQHRNIPFKKSKLTFFRITFNNYIDYVNKIQLNLLRLCQFVHLL